MISRFKGWLARRHAASHTHLLVQIYLTRWAGMILDHDSYLTEPERVDIYFDGFEGYLARCGCGPEWWSSEIREVMDLHGSESLR